MPKPVLYGVERGRNEGNGERKCGSKRNRTARVETRMKMKRGTTKAKEAKMNGRRR